MSNKVVVAQEANEISDFPRVYKASKLISLGTVSSLTMGAASEANESAGMML